MIKTTSPFVRRASCAVGALLALCAAQEAAAQAGKVNAAIDEQVRTEQAAQQSQQRVTQLDDETAQMLADYRQAVAEAESLRSYNDQLQTTIASQEEEMAMMTQQLGEIETTAREVLPLMNRMVTTFEQFVGLDVPFLMEERRERVANLKEMMASADVAVSEKYRRIVEAYQIEMEYGRTLESYQGKIDDKVVDFLRTGRVSLMYQTLDGGETGYWDQTQKTWVVDNSMDDAFRTAIKVAKKQAAPELLVVSVPAPQEVQ